jgi:hypothetical protein
MTREPVRHGTKAGYIHGACRCDACRAAHAAWLREYRGRLAVREVPARFHGTLTGYTLWSCRCARCRETWNAHHRALRARGGP